MNFTTNIKFFIQTNYTNVWNGSHFFGPQYVPIQSCPDYLGPVLLTEINFILNMDK